MTSTATIPAERYFKHELDEARRLGYRVQTNITGIAVAVRLIPKTQRTKRIAAQNGGAAIEAIVPCDTPAHRIDSLHAALTATLQHARDSAA